MICNECKKPLSDDEKYYLGDRCEECEKLWHEEIKSWRNGFERPEFDKFYSVSKPTQH